MCEAEELLMSEENETFQSNPIIFDDEDDDMDSIGAAFSPMRFDTMQRKVRDLLSDYNSQDLDPRPAFQRGFVWDKSRASRLLESILLNVPLPLIYTAEEENGKEVVIDGQQRLVSVFSFIQGQFPKDSSKFRLTGLKLLSKLNGKTFADLDEIERRAIQNYIFQIIRISRESQADVKFEIFERLNSGSVTLNAQELRNCVYRGKFNEVLKRLSENDNFLKVLGTSTVSSRMQDVELILRFLAFYERTYLNYQPGMKSFLNGFMNEYRNLSEEKAAAFEDTFKQSISLSFSVFGKNAFRKYSIGQAGAPSGSWERAINRPLFDIIMWGFTRFDKNRIMANSDEIRAALIDLVTTDKTFIDWITSATGDKTKTQYRFELWHERLKDIVLQKPQPRSFGYALKKSMYSSSNVCALCGQTIQNIDDAHIDHIKPFSSGGPTEIENAQLTHRFCNLQKSARAAS